MQTPLGVTKLDPDILRNYTTQAANPNPLEIYPVFLQPADNPADYAILASRLRRTYLHTEQATRFAAPMHLCDLAAEYV
jgi:RNaseH domain of pPIWI_RE